MLAVSVNTHLFLYYTLGKGGEGPMRRASDKVIVTNRVVSKLRMKGNMLPIIRFIRRKLLIGKLVTACL